MYLRYSLLNCISPGQIQNIRDSNLKSAFFSKTGVSEIREYKNAILHFATTQEIKY